MTIKTKKQWLGITYRNMKTHSKNRNMNEPCFSKQKFDNWIEERINTFNRLFNQYKKSGYKKDLVPSINRLNDYKTYSFENIELTTWKDNNKKGRISEKTINLVHKKLGHIAREYYKKSVGQYKNNILIKKYDAIRDTIKDGFDSSAVTKCCKGILRTHKGFCWRYLNE